jgi:peptidoglycan-N-acetylglucosamine deacetylase
MYLVKTPDLVKTLFPNFTWSVPSEEKTLYLTFDDGPIPDVTPWVLEQLRGYNAEATFFCVGENIAKNPDILKQILKEGHTVGNHTMQHLNGWTTDAVDYFHDVRHCARLTKSSLFRPPYGRVTPRQAQFLQRHYEVVMWDVLSGDFDTSITGEQCLRNVLQNATSGSIIVFHDSLKSEAKMKYALPRVLDYYAAKGYSFQSLTRELLENVREEKGIFQVA